MWNSATFSTNSYTYKCNYETATVYLVKCFDVRQGNKTTVELKYMYSIAKTFFLWMGGEGLKPLPDFFIYTIEEIYLYLLSQIINK